MYIALGNDGKRVQAEIADKSKNYICPVCGKKVICKQGKIKMWHFAHESGESCDDYWNYDMSEWHRRMQDYFAPEYREIVLDYGGDKHRADILKDGIVIEFQHSPVSIDEFEERNHFYQACGFRIVWVFDMTDRFASGQIAALMNSKTGNKLIWKNALKIFQDYPSPQDMEKDLSICFCDSRNHVEKSTQRYGINDEWHEGINAADNGDSIMRVQYTPYNQYQQPNWKYPRICTSMRISMCNSMYLEEFFMSPRDYCNALLKRIHGRYNIKYTGLENKKSDVNKCPINPAFRVGCSGKCKKCKYCGLIFTYEKWQGYYLKNISSTYCFYPNDLNSDEVPVIHENG